MEPAAGVASPETAFKAFPLYLGAIEVKVLKLRKYLKHPSCELFSCAKKHTFKLLECIPHAFHQRSRFQLRRALPLFCSLVSNQVCPDLPQGSADCLEMFPQMRLCCRIPSACSLITTLRISMGTGTGMCVHGTPLTRAVPASQWIHVNVEGSTLQKLKLGL